MSDEWPPKTAMQEAFDCARLEVTGSGIFSPDQSYILRQMLNLIEIAVKPTGEAE